MPTESSIKLAETIPGAKLEIVPGAGHLLFIERAEEFNKTVLGYLESAHDMEGKSPEYAPQKPGMLKKIISFLE